MARRVQTGRRSSTRCIQISAAVIFLVVISLLVSYYVYTRAGTKYTDPGADLACSEREATPIRNGVLQKNGSYIDLDTSIVYPIRYHFRVNGTLMGCTCALRPCLRKCCQADESFWTISERTICLKNNDTQVRPITSLNLTVYEMERSQLEVVQLPQNHFTVIYGEMCEFGRFRLQPEEYATDINYFMSNGSLYYLDKYFSSTDFCLETFIGDTALVTIVCFPPEDDATSVTTFQVYSSGMFASLPFLFLTFLVYVVLSELQNLHGKNLMCYVFNLFFAYLLLGVIQLSGKNLDQKFCVVFAFIIQFSFLASFFWLNIMCFDIWWVFSGLRPMHGSQKQREYKKFIIYSIYAWGCPTVIFIITLIMQHIEDDRFIKPDFGVNKCWFGNDDATFLYFYLPMIILIVMNIIMFITTACRLAAQKKETKEVLKRGDSKRHDDNDRQRFHLYLKLFIVMGVNWITELISWYIGGAPYLWYVTDLTNTLQGVLIFLIFVWKPRILALLNKRLCPNWNLMQSTSSTRSKVSPSRTTSVSVRQTSTTNTNPNPTDSISLKQVQTSEDSDGQA